MKKLSLSKAVLAVIFISGCSFGTAPVISRSGQPSPIVSNVNPSVIVPSSGAVASTSPVRVDESEKIAFMSNRSGFWDIYTMNTDGSNVQRLTKDDMKGPFSFSVSPDGRRLAYVSDKTGNPDLWVMDLNTKTTIQVTDTEFGDEGSPSWTSDSQSIAFHSDSKGEIYQILQVTYPLNENGKNNTQSLIAETTGNALHPAFSPDGTKLLYSLSEANGESMLHVYDYQSSKDTIITRKEDAPVNGTWEPGSNKVLYWTNNNGIFQVNADGSGNIQVGSIKNIKGSPYYSPDGKKIVFARGYGFADDYDVWVMDNDGRNPKRLTTEGGISLGWYKVNKTSLNPIVSPTPVPGGNVIVPSNAPYIDPNDPVINP